MLTFWKKQVKTDFIPFHTLFGQNKFFEHIFSYKKNLTTVIRRWMIFQSYVDVHRHQKFKTIVSER